MTTFVGACSPDPLPSRGQRTRREAVAWFTFASMTVCAGSARAADPDPWFGSDKALHFTISAGIAGAGYGVTTAFAEDRWKAWAVGGGVALAAGALKEGFDATGSGDPSWKDFTWDVIGATVGLAIAWGTDTVVHGGKAPPFVATAGSRAAMIAFDF